MNGREHEASGTQRYADRGATNFAPLPGRRRAGKYTSAVKLPPVPWKGAPDVAPYELWRGDCRACLANMGDDSVDSVVCDPPYELGFMGKSWDASGIAYDVELWREILRVLKPGGHLLAFGGSRTSHRLAVAIEDAGFEIRDSLIWLYGSGFPKSLDVSKAIDKAAGAERQVVGHDAVKAAQQTAKQGTDAYGNFAGSTGAITAPATPEAQQWEGWGTALKPAHEPIVMARKPLVGTVAANVLAHGVGGLNIDACRVPAGDAPEQPRVSQGAQSRYTGTFNSGEKSAPEARTTSASQAGRFPANVMHDGSEPVVAIFPDVKGAASRSGAGFQTEFVGGVVEKVVPTAVYNDKETSAARFFYCAKASKTDRGTGNTHPTVKPEALMRWCVRLVTPPGGLVFDPFTGSGSTGKAAILEGFRFIGAELTPEFWPIATARLDHAVN